MTVILIVQLAYKQATLYSLEYILYAKSYLWSGDSQNSWQKSMER